MRAAQAAAHSGFVCSRGKNIFIFILTSCYMVLGNCSNGFIRVASVRTEVLEAQLFATDIISLDVKPAHFSPHKQSTFARVKASPELSDSFTAAAQEGPKTGTIPVRNAVQVSEDKCIARRKTRVLENTFQLIL